MTHSYQSLPALAAHAYVESQITIFKHKLCSQISYTTFTLKEHRKHLGCELIICDFRKGSSGFVSTSGQEHQERNYTQHNQYSRDDDTNGMMSNRH